MKSLCFCFLSLIIFGLVISIGIGCGGSGNNDENTGDDIPQVLQGQFIDAPVQGINFLSGSQSGVTDANGGFKYEVGKKIKFSIGDIQLGIETIAKKIITPLDLVENGTLENTTVLNIARFIQSLDSDPSDNVITIPTSVKENATNQSLDFSDNTTFENNANNLLTDLTNNNEDYQSSVNLIDSSTAKDHMLEELNDLDSSNLTGYWRIYFTVEGQSEERPEYLIFSQSGNNLTGSLICEVNDTLTGRINGTNILLSFSDNESTGSLTGTIMGYTIEGTWTETGGDSGTWRAEKSGIAYTAKDCAISSVGVFCTRFLSVEDDKYYVQGFIKDYDSIIESVNISGSHMPVASPFTYNLYPIKKPGEWWTNPNIFISQGAVPLYPLYYIIHINFKDGTSLDISKSVTKSELAE